MKKNDIVLLVVGIVLVIIGLFAYSKKTSSTFGGEVEKPSTEVGIHEISFKQYQYLTSTEDKDIIFIGATGCGWCEKYRPVLEEVASENNLTVYYLDIANLNNTSYNDLVNSNDWLKSNQWGTPTTLILTSNKTVDVLEGYAEKDKVVEFFKNNGYIAG